MLVAELASLLANADPTKPVLVEAGMGFADVAGLYGVEGIVNRDDPETEIDTVVIALG